MRAAAPTATAPTKAQAKDAEFPLANPDELKELEQAIERAAEYVQGGGLERPQYVFERPRVDAREIREALGLSRQDFAMTFGLSLRTIQNWEEGRREPEGPAKAFLIAILHEPKAVARAQARYRQGKAGVLDAKSAKVPRNPAKQSA